MVERSELERFATASDYDACRRLHRQYGTTYYFATTRFPRPVRQRVHALYGFVRVPDEIVDGAADDSDRRQRLQNYRRQLVLGMEGVVPDSEVLRAFCDVCQDIQMPLDEPLLFLDAMESDLDTNRYETYAELKRYMRGSAAAVGLMMCHVLGVPRTPEIEAPAMALGEAMQLTNFLRDIGEDLARGRIYLPQEDLASFEVTEQDIHQSGISDSWCNLMRFEIERARALYRIADKGIGLLPRTAQKPVKLARVLYARILDRIEDRDYDVFTARARTTKAEKLACALKTMLTSA